MYPIHAFGSDEQKEKYLPKMARGEIIGCFGLTEPDFGSNPDGMLTKATKLRGGGYRLDGTKRWITNGNMAHVALVWAKLDGVVRGFLVPTDTKGFTAHKIDDKFSLRASVTSELVLEDFEVGEDAILPGVRGMKGPLSCLSQARYGICWGVDRRGARPATRPRSRTRRSASSSRGPSPATSSSSRSSSTC